MKFRETWPKSWEDGSLGLIVLEGTSVEAINEELSDTATKMHDGI